ncbi:hypothetical protein AYI70_g9234 [Smittium culicis]|uniref:Uncharacterized protein n=1 Tax=Smittium culicis TaxID=133412 RepID=A0A1R1XCA2_9FUNG|nr:hypothetical protein AYI70_g9234 [Smittium culicis]
MKINSCKNQGSEKWRNGASIAIVKQEASRKTNNWVEEYGLYNGIDLEEIPVSDSVNSTIQALVKVAN